MKEIIQSLFPAHCCFSVKGFINAYLLLKKFVHLLDQMNFENTSIWDESFVSIFCAWNREKYSDDYMWVLLYNMMSGF